MITITKRSIAKEIAYDLSITDAKGMEITESILLDIRMAMLSKRSIWLRGVGFLNYRLNPSVDKRCPQTGTILVVPERDTYFFAKYSNNAYNQLTLTELQKGLREGLGLTVKQSRQAVRRFIDLFKLVYAMPSRYKIAIKVFGSFTVKRNAPHRGVNPGTGESILIKETKRARFKVSKHLMKALRQDPRLLY